MGRRLLWALEFAGITSVVWMLRVMPIRWAYRLARGLGWVAYRLDRKHREVAESNLCRVLDLNPSDPKVAAYARSSFCQFTYTAVEMAKLGALFGDGSGEEGSRGKIKLNIRGQEVLEQANQDGKGLVFVSGHNGCWEVMGPIMGALGHPIHVVARPLDNPFIDRWSRRYRERYDVRIVNKAGALGQLVRVLRGGGHIGFLIDQHAGRHGIWVEYLGKMASTMPSPAALARRFHRPIVAGFSFRTANPWTVDVEFELVGRPDPSLDKDADIRRLTERVNQVIGERALAVPDQYLWLHRRWREVPKTRDRRDPGQEVRAGESPAGSGSGM